MGTARYVGSRLLQGLVVVFGALVVSFGLGAIAGDPADLVAGSFGTTNPRLVEQIRDSLGYGDPLPVRFVHYVADTASLDLGTSYRSGESALRLVMEALPNTLVLVAGALLLGLLIAVPFASWSVLRRERLDDRLLRRGLAIAQGMPDFWLALMLALVFSVSLAWFPTIGFEGPSSLVLPVTALAVPIVPTLVRVIRAELLEVMQRDFVLALRAKGLTEPEIVARHALWNVMPHVITFVALQAGWLVGGTLVIESIFGWPGLGTLLIDAVQAHDLAVVQAAVMVIAVSYVLLNLLADLAVLAIDPRIRVVTA
jgi:ABC-type dipeptide/oligopeptide/nickel transport system permease component